MSVVPQLKDDDSDIATAQTMIKNLTMDFTCGITQNKKNFKVVSDLKLPRW